YKGSFGLPIIGTTRNKAYECLPSHARRPNKIFPRWKINMIRNNREFYKKNRKIIDSWKKKIMSYPSSFQKLELNRGDEERDLRKYVIQCRASGIRVKRLTTSPSLVAMNNTQVPIIPWEDRYMTPHECSRLQSMDTLKHLPVHRSKAYKALGNAVNTEVVEIICSRLLNGGDS
ncbi:MAG: DNA cytosine methyltransferase, partial [Patescibacteria group bacterium]|nr:DNA cytosine methyltransferase [Patescibacteria group bacterium]